MILSSVSALSHLPGRDAFVTAAGDSPAAA